MTTTPIAISSIGMSSTASASVTSEEVSEERTKALVLPPLVALPKQILKVLVHEIGFPVKFFLRSDHFYVKLRFTWNVLRHFFGKNWKIGLISIWATLIQNIKLDFWKFAWQHRIVAEKQFSWLYTFAVGQKWNGQYFKGIDSFVEWIKYVVLSTISDFRTYYFCNIVKKTSLRIVHLSVSYTAN